MYYTNKNVCTNLKCAHFLRRVNIRTGRPRGVTPLLGSFVFRTKLRHSARLLFVRVYFFAARRVLTSVGEMEVVC